MKQQVQAFLKRVGIYQRVKRSRLYDLYWRVADRKLIDNRDREVEFFRRTLVGFRPGNLIFDIGANHGQKIDVFLRLGARIVALEPDRSNQEILEQSFHRFRLSPKPVVIVGKAVSDHAGVETMFVDEPGSAKNTLNRKWVDTLRTDSARFGSTLDFGEKTEVETTTVEELIRAHGRPFFMKIDVEGHEPSVLKGMSSPIPFVSFEVNLPEFKPEGVECIQLLEQVAANGRFNYAADCTRGLDLPQWLPAAAFLTELENCKKPCIEIFWKAPETAAVQ
jgi:FkbM family methyltransferase